MKEVWMIILWLCLTIHTEGLSSVTKEQQINLFIENKLIEKSKQWTLIQLFPFILSTTKIMLSVLILQMPYLRWDGRLLPGEGKFPQKADKQRLRTCSLGPLGSRAGVRVHSDQVWPLKWPFLIPPRSPKAVSKGVGGSSLLPALPHALTHTCQNPIFPWSCAHSMNSLFGSPGETKGLNYRLVGRN